ncbi:MAG: ABC transporter permease [Acidobacteria bacterium]|nr:ABC transporter permease [Acidobacteriota bacterium]
MSAYLLKRLLFAALTVFVAITVNFVLFRALPGDAVSGLKCRQCTAEFKEAQRVSLGLDKSLGEQYVLYLKGLTHGDLGNSWRPPHPTVWSQLWTPIKRTVPMILLGTLFSVVLGVAVGLLAAWRRGSLLDRVSTGVSLAAYSMPTQWLALLMVLYVAGWLGLPSSGVKDPDLELAQLLGEVGWWDLLVDQVKHMVMPALAIGIVFAGDYAIITRSALVETLSEDYVLTARAKGLSRWSIIRRHALPNAALPIITLVALSLGTVVGGVLVVEYVFSYSGIGLTVVQAIAQRDYPVLQGAFLLLTVAVVVANLVADLLYPKLDPRVVLR